MAFTVRVFTYRGMVQGPILIPFQDSKDSVFLMQEPYEAAMSVNTNGSTPLTLGPSPQNPDIGKIAIVEIPDGQFIRYEVNGLGQRNVPASANSPLRYGIRPMNWAAGMVLSIIEGP